jgi:hypothetical protein
MTYRRIASAVLLGLLLAAAPGLVPAQQAGRDAQENRKSPEVKAPQAAGEPKAEAPREAQPAKDEKRAPPKPFEPTEKVKADQAIDFPADI